MGKKDRVPDAWEDDDWETLADRAARDERPKTDAVADADADAHAPAGAPTRAERLARHNEAQRKLWEAAEAPEDINFLAATTTVPLATPFKPAVKLLARNPAPRLVARRDPVTGLDRLTLQDDDDDDEGAAREQPTLEEIRARQQREREEKQRRYDEARAKIFGESRPSSGQSTPGATTPPRGSGGEGGGPGRGQGQKGRGRGRGRNEMRSGNRQETSGRRQGDGNQSAGARELYDPNDSPRPAGSLQKRRGDGSDPSCPAPREREQIIRKPRGPDGSGPGGIGFVRRGTREA